jgi:hypothetical protein
VLDELSDAKAGAAKEPATRAAARMVRIDMVVLIGMVQSGVGSVWGFNIGRGLMSRPSMKPF